MRKSIISVLFLAALPLHMSDVEAAASAGEPAPDAAGATSAPADAVAATPDVAEDPNVAVSPADAAPESASASSAQTAPTDAATGTTATPSVDAAAAPTNDDTGKVEIAADSHAEAKDRFAGLLATLGNIEHELVDSIRGELLALGTLLHLHSTASVSAQTTGDYQASDVS
ncbi:hypothetical protein [Paraburkholderia saeva]|uniref:hypothetical protein n=1 Tax=Paraburkholderia saeva TaxID=2777537 RepID=UPI001D634D86|nr:hypothetical protein [Paraburkholderia saeva]CAG4887925.1 hypothetical protein R52603_00539 [Paraburkholderia saeva]